MHLEEEARAQAQLAPEEDAELTLPPDEEEMLWPDGMQPSSTEEAEAEEVDDGDEEADEDEQDPGIYVKKKRSARERELARHRVLLPDMKTFRTRKVGLGAKDIFEMWKFQLEKEGFVPLSIVEVVQRLSELTWGDLKTIKWMGKSKEDHPFLKHLSRRTREFVNASHVSTETACAILGALPLVQKQWPKVTNIMASILLPLVDATKLRSGDDDFQALTVGRLLPAAAQLGPRVAAPLWDAILPVIEEMNVDRILPENVPAFATALGDARDKASDIINATSRRLQESVVFGTDMYKPPELAVMLEGFRRAGGITDSMQDMVGDFLFGLMAYQRKLKRPLYVDPELTQIACIFAQVGIKNPDLLKVVARAAVEDTLATMSRWGVAALQWAYTELADAGDGFDLFRRKLAVEVVRRNISAAMVNEARRGPDGGGIKLLKDYWMQDGGSIRKDKPLVLAPQVGVRITQFLYDGSRKAQFERAGKAWPPPDEAYRYITEAWRAEKEYVKERRRALKLEGIVAPKLPPHLGTPERDRLRKKLPPAYEPGAHWKTRLPKSPQMPVKWLEEDKRRPEPLRVLARGGLEEE